MTHHGTRSSLETIVIVGGSLAGYRTAQALRDFGFRGVIHLVGDEPHLPYDRPPLSKEYLARTLQEERIWLASLSELDRLELALELGQTAVSVDVEGRQVELDDGSRLPYDALVVATGARPRLVGGLTPTSRPESVHTLRTIEDARGLSERLTGPSDQPHQLVVVGGGFIGSEVAWTAQQLGARVTIIDSRDTPMNAVLHSEVGSVLAARQIAAGVELSMRSRVQEIMVSPSMDGQGPYTEVRSQSGVAHRADTVVVGVGVTPNTGWLDGSGLAIDDGLLCDSRLIAGPQIFAAGDVTRWAAADGTTQRLEHWTNASAQALHVARNILAGDAATDFQDIPYYWSDQFGFRLEVVGLPPDHCDLEFAWGSPASDAFLAVYRSHGEVVGCVGLNARDQIRKCRVAFQRADTWTSGFRTIEFA
jgi:3-phenylpropionate/trans-cinnamate dioxygenase ferredoxin reductase subunit